MPDMNIRNVPDELLIRTKTKAAMEDKTLRQVVIDLLEQYSASVAGLVEQKRPKEEETE